MQRRRLTFFDVHLYVLNALTDERKRLSTQLLRIVTSLSAFLIFFFPTLSLSRSLSLPVYLLTFSDRMFAHHTLYVFMQLRYNPRLNRSQGCLSSATSLSKSSASDQIESIKATNT